MRKPTLLSLRDRLTAEEVPGSSDGKVTGRGGISILGLPPQTPAPLKPFPTLLRKVTGRGGPLMRTSSGKVAGKAFPVR